MRYFPLFLDLQGHPALVVGGGPVAARKVALLREAGATVEVVAPGLCEALSLQADDGSIRHTAAPFDARHVDAQRLVVAATGDPRVDRAVAAAAASAGIPVNVVDDLALSSAIVPAIVDRSPLLVAISSGGAAPMLARLVRERLEALLDESLGPLAQLLAGARRAIRRRFGELAERRRFYSTLLDGPLPGLLRAGRRSEAERLLQCALETGSEATATGRVVLVGAGPGDPGLLTLRALRALQEADVVLHDRLVSPGVLALTRRDAERLDVGKQARAASTAQEHIHALLLEHARRGRTVVRLKGGDPFVFGRGGEELEFLRANGVPVEVVPGITAALGAAARAQVPLTRRGRASGLRILSAESGATGVDVDWASHAASRDTLAVYMGLAQLDWLGPTLIQLGRPASTPVVLVAGATRVDEQIVHGTLAQLVALASNAALRSPVLLIVGEVAAGSVGQALSARELERAS